MNTETFDRVPPHDIQAEQAVLGGMMLARDVIGDVTEVLGAGADFYRPAHETIYAAILDLYGRGEPADPITVAAALTKTGQMPAADGAAYLHTLVEQTPSAASAAYYAQTVKDRAALRRLVEAGTRITQLAYAGEGEVAEILDQAGTAFSSAVAGQDEGESILVGDGFESYADRLERLQREGHTTGVLTGFTDLDALTHGLHPGQVVIVAARPAMGKSTLALDFARSAAVRHRRTTAFFSLEMSRPELMDRLMSAEARVALHHMRMQGGMTDEDWTRFARRSQHVQTAPLHIDDTSGQTVLRIKSRCRRIQQRHGLDLVVIDYLQLLESGASRRAENRQVEVSAMSRQIKLMAKELGVPVVILSQLNRGPEQRTDKKPVLSDLRESGSLEQDADVVILLHREDAYEKESPRAGEADLIVAKHRNGPTATITVAAQLHYSRFVDMAQT